MLKPIRFTEHVAVSQSAQSLLSDKILQFWVLTAPSGHGEFYDEESSQTWKTQIILLDIKVNENISCLYFILASQSVWMFYICNAEHNSIQITD